MSKLDFVKKLYNGKNCYSDHMGERPRGTHVKCEVYSCQKETGSKGCSNWKERKRNDRK